MYWIIGLYGLFCIAGGIIGFIKADSLTSLLVGGIGGLILLACAWSRHKIGALIALIISLAFGLRFFFPLMTQFKVMPHLLMVIFSAIAALAAIWALVGEKRSR